MASQTILVVSPESYDRSLSVDLMSTSGMPIIEAEQSVEAISLLETKEEIGLVVIYHRPPQLQGDQLVQQIRSIKATTPIIFVCDLMDSQILINVLRYDHLTLMQRDNLTERLLFAAINHLKTNKRYDGSERRKFRRIDTKLKASMGAFGAGIVLNLSAGGGFVGTPQKVEMGSDIVLDIPILGEDSVITGKVVWAVPAKEDGSFVGGIGIQFTEPTAEQSKALAKFIFLQVKDTILK